MCEDLCNVSATRTSQVRSTLRTTLNRFGPRRPHVMGTVRNSLLPYQ